MVRAVVLPVTLLAQVTTTFPRSQAILPQPMTPRTQVPPLEMDLRLGLPVSSAGQTLSWSTAARRLLLDPSRPAELV